MPPAVTLGPETTTDEILANIDLRNQVALVTGASGGLGAETARALASRGAAVTLAVRDVAKGEQVAARIRESTSNPAIDVMGVELSVPESVRSFAKEYLASHDRLNLLINNAGVMACPLTRTPEGWEQQFATCHLGHFLLTCSLVSALEAGSPARVVNLSSGGHRFGTVDFDDIHFDSRPYDKWIAYGQAKTANILFSVELTRRLESRGITANAVHPGVIMTDLSRHLQASDLEVLKSRRGDRPMVLKSVEAGAATTVWAATAPELAGRGGLYLEDCQVSEPISSPDAPRGYTEYATNPEDARRLWAISEQLLGQSFNLAP